MAEFFKKAPVHDTFQKRFFESIFHKHNIVGSFPMGYSVLSLYSLPAMMGQGMAVVVCTDTYAIHRNREALKQSGYDTPTVCVLDGTQMPHEERDVQEHINQNRVQILFTTPERFCSLTFMQILVHANVSFLAIEEAHYLLDGFAGTYRYWKLWEGLSNLRKRPPVVLFSHALPPARLHELTRRLKLKSYEAFQKEPAIHQTQIRVKKLLTEHEKLRYLCGQMAGHPQDGQMGQVLNPGSVIIRTNGRKTCQKVSAALAQFGFDPVLIYHPGLAPQEKEQVEWTFRNRPNAVVVMFGYGERFLVPPANGHVKFFFWQMPASIEEAFGTLFQVPSGDVRTVEGHILYTKEDYNRIFNRLNYEWENELGTKFSQHQQARSLKQFRQWVLSEGCRFQTLIAYWQGGPMGEVPACGYCDRCLSTSNDGFFRKILGHWIY